MPSPTFITNPTWNPTDERGSLTQVSGLNYLYSIGPLTTTVSSPGADTLTVLVQPTLGHSFTTFGTSVCEIFATVFYN